MVVNPLAVGSVTMIPAEIIETKTATNSNRGKFNPITVKVNLEDCCQHIPFV